MLAEESSVGLNLSAEFLPSVAKMPIVCLSLLILGFYLIRILVAFFSRPIYRSDKSPDLLQANCRYQYAADCQYQSSSD